MPAHCQVGYQSLLALDGSREVRSEQLDWRSQGTPKRTSPQRHTKKQAVERRRHGKTEAAIQADPDSQDVQAEPDLQDAQGNPELQAAGVPVAPDPAVFANRYDCVDDMEQSALDAGVSEAEVGVELQPIFVGGRLREATVVDLLMEHATAHNISREGMQGFVDVLNLLILDGGVTKRVLKK
eukprot:g5066.t1